MFLDYNYVRISAPGQSSVGPIAARWKILGQKLPQDVWISERSVLKLSFVTKMKSPFVPLMVAGSLLQGANKAHALFSVWSIVLSGMVYLMANCLICLLGVSRYNWEEALQQVCLFGECPLWSGLQILGASTGCMDIRTKCSEAVLCDKHEVSICSTDGSW